MRVEELLTVNELTEKLKVSKAAISQWIEQGLPCEFRKPYRFYWSKVEKWLKNRG